MFEKSAAAARRSGRACRPSLAPCRLDDEGETAAVALAEFLRADLLPIDERDGYRVARRKGLSVTGTAGLLDLAAKHGLIDFVRSRRNQHEHDRYHEVGANNIPAAGGAARSTPEETPARE